MRKAVIALLLAVLALLILLSSPVVITAGREVLDIWRQTGHLPTKWTQIVWPETGEPTVPPPQPSPTPLPTFTPEPTREAGWPVQFTGNEPLCFTLEEGVSKLHWKGGPIEIRDQDDKLIFKSPDQEGVYSKPKGVEPIGWSITHDQILLRRTSKYAFTRLPLCKQ